MHHRSPLDRMRAAGLLVRRMRRTALGQLDRARVLHWVHGTWHADELAIVPPDLRTSDASFALELAAGEVGLAGAVASLHATSPFQVVPPTEAWLAELHGFAWLRHLAAAARAGGAEGEEATRRARKLLADWTSLGPRRPEVAAEPGVAARRVLSWIAHAGLLLEGASEGEHDRFASSLAADLRSLQLNWSFAEPASARLFALTALVEAALCIQGHDRQLLRSERRLVAELDRQLLADGGHISRDTSVLVDLVLDLLPLRQCYLVLGRPFPVGIANAIERMLAMLRRMRLGDGSLARFNGVGYGAPDAVATASAYDDDALPADTRPGPTGYARLERGGTIIVVDVGSAPPLEQAGRAHAGALSFEMSVGRHLFIANRGAPSPTAADLRQVARATASHSTMVVGGASSARLVRDPQIIAEIGGQPIVGPANVAAHMTDNGIGDVELDATHDGYRASAGVVHRRRLKLAGDGHRLAGIDSLELARSGKDPRPLDVAIHFHLPPTVACRPDEAPGRVVLELAGGPTWTLEVSGATIALEDSSHLATVSGPHTALDVVARVSAPAPLEVHWALSRRDDGPRTRTAR